jgi:hypothetical protein
MAKEELTLWLGNSNGSVGDDDAQRMTGWSPSTIRRVRGAIQFEGRRTALAVPLTTALPSPVKAALAKATNPDVFRGLTELADVAGLKASEVNGYVRQANEKALTDPEAALQIIAEAKADNGQRIEERRAGLRVTTPLNQQMSMHLGWVIKQGAPGLHDTNSYTGPKSKLLLEDSVEVLKDALARYN